MEAIPHNLYLPKVLWLETFGCVAAWDDMSDMVDVWASQPNPPIVARLVYGGTMRGMDVALMSPFVYSDRGQLLTSTFMDHLLSSALDVPHMTMDDVCTPAPGYPLGAAPVKAAI